MNSKKESLWSKVSTFLVFAGPATFAFLAVVIVPFLYGVYLTFTSWDGVRSAFRRSRSMRSIIYRERSFSKIMAMRPSQSTGFGVRLPVRKEGFVGGGKEDNDESERNTMG